MSAIRSTKPITTTEALSVKQTRPLAMMASGRVYLFRTRGAGQIRHCVSVIIDI